MANAIIGYVNRIDEAVLTTDSQVTAAPISALQAPHVAESWRAVGGVTSCYILAAFAAQYPLGALALIGTNLSAGATWRVRLSTNDATGANGNAYDSGTIGAGVDTAYGYAIHIFPTAKTGRYLRIDITDATLSQIEAGRWFAGPAWQPENNFSFDWSRGWRSRARKTISRGGQKWIDELPRPRLLQLTFDYITDAEAKGGDALELLRLAGDTVDVLVVTDPESANLGRESIWGTVEGETVLRNWAHGLHALPLFIEERL